MTEPKKWIKDYQPTDKNGLPIGPPQHFEADTQGELIEKLVAAHQNASAALYETRRAVKLGVMLEPDTDEPMETFEERQLSADEMVRIQKMLGDPAKAAEAHQILLEAKLGVPLPVLRQRLQELEVSKRVDKIRANIAQFLSETPEYVDSESNRDTLKKYMEKKGRSWTVNNLKIAFEDLRNSDLLTIRAPQAEVPVVAAPVIPPVIPVEPTKEPEIPVTPPEVPLVAKQSSSGLGRQSSSAPAGAGTPPKVSGITIADINRMPAAEYQTRLKDPEFRKQVEELYKKS